MRSSFFSPQPGIVEIAHRLTNQSLHDRRMDSPRVLRCAAMLALALPSVSSATTLAKLSLDDLVSLSDEIVGVRCESSRTEGLGRKVYTVTTFRVNAATKGASAVGQSFGRAYARRARGQALPPWRCASRARRPLIPAARRCSSSNAMARRNNFAASSVSRRAACRVPPIRKPA